MAEVLVGVFLTYVICGVHTVVTDLGTEPLHRPGWALRPTFGVAGLVALTWFTRPYVEQYGLHGQRGRSAAFGTLNLVAEFGVQVAALSYLAGFLLAHFNFVFVVAVLGVVFAVGIFILPTLASVIALPITFVGSIPLNFIFPLKRTGI